MWVWYLGQEDPLEEGMATHLSILAWRISWTEEPGRLCNHRVAKSWTRLKWHHTSMFVWGCQEKASVQFSCSVVSDSLRPHELQHARPPCPSPTPGVHSDSCPSSWWCHPAISSSVVSFSSCPQSLSASVFSNESTLHMRWPKYWSFSFSIIPSKEIPGLISFRMDWLDLLSVQGTLKSLLQHHNSKASILWCSAFVTVQLSHPYITTGKTIALTRRNFIGKVMSLLFNMLSRVGHNFPSKECLLISWLQSPSAVILETPSPKKKI